MLGGMTRFSFILFLLIGVGLTTSCGKKPMLIPISQLTNSASFQARVESSYVGYTNGSGVAFAVLKTTDGRRISIEDHNASAEVWGCVKKVLRKGKTYTFPDVFLASQSKTTDEILSHDTGAKDFNVLGVLLGRIDLKAQARGETGLTETEHRLLAVYSLEAAVNNGGFAQFFFDSAGNRAEAALTGLKEMGAAGAAALLKRTMAVFPGGQPPADQSKRQKVMQQIAAQSKPVWSQCDSEFYKFNESIRDLSLAYAKKKRAEIVWP
jgi:hypothetical protein